jgi:putative oxidoreductase
MSSTTARPTAARQARAVVQHATDRLAAVLTAHSLTALRISLGTVFLAFASLKFVAGASPAEGLAVATVSELTLGMVTGPDALLLTALTETLIGATLLTGRLVRLGLVVLAVAIVGILSPLALFPDQMWADGGPTLAGQYVFKDIVLVAAALVVTAHALGARLRTGEDG